MSRTGGVYLFVLIACLIAAPSAFADSTPVYFFTFADAVTGPNAFAANDGKRYWRISPGADSYQNEFYERPTAQNYQVRTLPSGEERFASQEYFGTLDIVRGKFGFDADFLYFATEIYSRDRRTSDFVDIPEMLDYEYGIRLSTDPDGRNGLLLRAEQPESKHGTTFGLQSNEISQDTNSDVGGRAINGCGPTGINVTKSDNPGEQDCLDNLDGFDADVVDDGIIDDGPREDTPVLYSRIDPLNNHIVEFAFAYRDFGLNDDFPQLIQYLDFQAIKGGGPQDPENYFWNDKYTKSGAGSPYRATSGDLSKSEFGTQGLQNLYELDTLRGTLSQSSKGSTSIPEPNTLLLLGIGLAAVAARKLRKEEHKTPSWKR